jgi:hypothetical protein
VEEVGLHGVVRCLPSSALVREGAWSLGRVEEAGAARSVWASLGVGRALVYETVAVEVEEEVVA